MADPRLYCAWPVLLVAVLYAAYVANPYLFGLAVFALGPATGLVCVVGTLFVVLARGASWPARVAVLASLVLSGAAVLGALAVLDRFHWA